MSRIDSFLSKIINIFLWVSIVSFIFLVIELFFSVAYQALDCSPDQLYCTIRPENPFLQTTITTLITILIIFLFTTRMLYSVLEKDSALLNATEYKNSLINRRITFSRTKVYTDLRNKSAKGSRAPKNIKIKDELEKVVEEKDEDITTAQLIHEVEEDAKIDHHLEDESMFYTRLNKGELIDIINRATTLNQKSSKLFLNTMLKVIIEELKKDNEVKIAKFGKFKRVFVEAHKKTNKKSGKEVQIEAGSNVYFYPDKAFSLLIADSEQTSDKLLLTKSEMDKLSEDQVQDELIREEKIREHVELKVVLDPIKEEEKKKAKKKATVTKTKLDVINYIHKNTKLSKNKSNKFLNEFEKVITEELKSGREVNIPGLGTFLTILMPKKEAMNPQTHKIIVVNEHRQVRLRIDSEFKNKFK